MSKARRERQKRKNHRKREYEISIEGTKRWCRKEEGK